MKDFPEGASRAGVIQDYVSPYPQPIVFHRGEEVIAGKEFKADPDWKDWIWCDGREGKKAWVPGSYLNREGQRGTFIKEYNAMELTIHAGEELIVHEKIHGFGMAEKSDGTKGWVPLRNLMFIDASRDVS